MTNKILAHLKKGSLLPQPHCIVAEFKKFPTHNKIGLGLGVTSLGMSVASFRNNKANMELNESKADLDKKSLNALQKIHKALSTRVIVAPPPLPYES